MQNMVRMYKNNKLAINHILLKAERNYGRLVLSSKLNNEKVTDFYLAVYPI